MIEAPNPRVLGSDPRDESRVTKTDEFALFEGTPFRIGGHHLRIVVDLAILVAAFWSAYLLRFDFRIPPELAGNFWSQLPVVVLLQFVAIRITGAHRFIWRYIGMFEVAAFLKAAAWSTLPLVALRFGLPEAYQQFRVPVSVILIDAFLAYGFVFGVRVVRRAVYEKRRSSGFGAPAAHCERVLFVGAGRAGVLAAREIMGSSERDIEPVGFVDDDPLKQGSVMCGLRVYGTTRDLPVLVNGLGIDQIVITIARSDRAQIRRIVKICEAIPVRVRTVPGFLEVLQGNVALNLLRDLDPEELLGRTPVSLDADLLASFLSGRTVLITGAGGSIGSELARQVARLRPSQLLLVERSEPALFEVDQELTTRFPEVPITPLVADVGDGARMRKILEDHRPSVLIHAAAHKHVTLMEKNPCEAVKNNILATDGLCRLSAEFQVDTFVLISTDKAVQPTSIMGASKRVAELVVQGHDRAHDTKFVAVRFGNVLGSAGSVIPIFRRQIEQGGPVTITDPQATRYFMSIPEASQLVLTAAAMGSGGNIFVLDMGKPVRIVALAERLIRLSGFEPYEEIDIRFIGLRPGEKLNEEFANPGEDVRKTDHEQIHVGTIEPAPESQLELAIEELRTAAESGAADQVRKILMRVVPEARLSQQEERRAGVV